MRSDSAVKGMMSHSAWNRFQFAKPVPLIMAHPLVIYIIPPVVLLWAIKESLIVFVQVLGSHWLCDFLQGQAIKYGLAHFLAKKALKASWEALLMNQVTLIRETPARWALRTHKRRKPASMHYEFE